MSDQVQASHILLMYAGSMRSSAKRTKEEAEELINKIKGKIDSGIEFEGLAKQYSDCPSGAKGGDLGTFGKGQMVKEFEDTTWGMEVGAISAPFETPFGYHIIKRTG